MEIKASRKQSEEQVSSAEFESDAVEINFAKALNDPIGMKERRGGASVCKGQTWNAGLVRGQNASRRILEG